MGLLEKLFILTWEWIGNIFNKEVAGKDKERMDQMVLRVLFERNKAKLYCCGKGIVREK